MPGLALPGARPTLDRLRGACEPQPVDRAELLLLMDRDARELFSASTRSGVFVARG